MHAMKQGKGILIVAILATPLVAFMISFFAERAFILALYGIAVAGSVEIRCRKCLNAQAKKGDRAIAEKVRTRNLKQLNSTDAVLNEMIEDYKKLAPFSIAFLLLILFIGIVVYAGFS